MRKDITVSAELRETRGKNEARRLRVKGFMPAVVYGGEAGPEAVAVSPKELTKILQSKTGHNTIFDLDLAGQSRIPVMIVDWQFEPIKGSLLHADLKRIDLNQRLIVKVPVVTVGDPRGVKLQGGIHEIVTREIEIETLPNEIPEQYVVNVADLGIGQGIRVGDIPLGGSVRLVSTPEALVSHVVSLRADDTAAATPEGVPAGSEPEVIKKGKKEEGGAEAAAPPKKK